jgi:hypothetical protein
MNMFSWLQHAFAIEPAGPAHPTPVQAALIDRVCQEVVRREMTLPAQMILDTSGPISFVVGQSMRFFEPFLMTVLNPNDIREFATFLERRGAVEYISLRLDSLSPK